VAIRIARILLIEPPQRRLKPLLIRDFHPTSKHHPPPPFKSVTRILIFPTGHILEACVVFNLAEPRDLDYIRPYFPGVDKAAKLLRFHFIAYNRNSGVELGRL
jgi:hypothetical protein